jgi:hypothetical protein
LGGLLYKLEFPHWDSSFLINGHRDVLQPPRHHQLVRRHPAAPQCVAPAVRDDPDAARVRDVACALRGFEATKVEHGTVVELLAYRVLYNTQNKKVQHGHDRITTRTRTTTSTTTSTTTATATTTIITTTLTTTITTTRPTYNSGTPTYNSNPQLIIRELYL